MWNIGQPFDTVKVRIQSSSIYSGVLDCTWRTLRTEGMFAFYKGMLSPLLGNAPLNAIVFGANGSMSRLLQKHYPQPKHEIEQGIPSYWRVGLSAMYGGAYSCIVCVPMELIKCRLQVLVDGQALSAVQPSLATTSSTHPSPSPTSPLSTPSSISSSAPYNGPWSCIKYTYRIAGLAGLYRGWWTTWWRDVPAYASWFIAYEACKYHLSTPVQRSNRQYNTGTLLTAGGAAGVATWLSTYPFDVLKSVVQTAPIDTPRAQLKMWYIAKTYYKLYGINWFFKGLTPTLIRAIPTSAVTFWVYELMLDAMGR